MGKWVDNQYDHDRSATSVYYSLGLFKVSEGILAISEPRHVPSRHAITFDISPNPLPAGSDLLMVRATGLQPGSARLEVIDLNGRIRFQSDFEATGNAAQHALDLSGLSAGVYLLSLRRGRTSAQKKLVVC